MSHRRNCVTWFAYLLFALFWVLLGLVAFFLAGSWAMYADLRSPRTSFHTSGTGLEQISRLMYMRYFVPESRVYLRFDPEITYVPKPSTARLSTVEFDSTVTISPEGVRAQPPVSDPAQRGLIVMVGDSYTFGWGVSDNETFSDLLAEKYHFRTVNTGVPSYGTAREFYHLRQLGLIKDAAMVVVQYCDNDGPENLAFLQSPETFYQPTNQRANWDAIDAFRQVPMTFWNVTGLNARYVWKRITADSPLSYYRELKDRQPPHDRRYPPGAPRSAINFLAVLDHFPELAGKPMIVTEMNGRNKNTGFLEALKAAAKDRPNIRVLDISFADNDAFRFDLHLTPAGHRHAAAEIAKAITEFQADIARSGQHP